MKEKKRHLPSLYSMNWKICLIHYHYISSHINANYSVTVVNMSKIHPCQILFRLMMKVGVASLGCWRLLRVAGTVCGRPLAHMPAPLSTLLTLPTLATPWCTSPPPLCCFVHPHNLPAKKETTQVVPSQDRLTSPAILSILPLLVFLPWLPSSSPSSVAGVVIQRDTLLAEINPF